MDIILNAIKCSICHEILESPVVLPCNETICKKHVSNQLNDNFFRCDKCGVEHQIPTNGFPPNIALQNIIEVGIAGLDFGNVHNEAKKSCESFEKLLQEVEVLLKDPYIIAHERISELKNSVQLKGNELKLIVDEEIKKLIDRLDEYERQSNEYLSTNEFKVESEKLENQVKSAQSNLNSWLACLKE